MVNEVTYIRSADTSCARIDSEKFVTFFTEIGEQSGNNYRRVGA